MLRRKLRRDARRSWPQLLAVAVTVTLGVGLFGASYDAFHSLEASYEVFYEDLEMPDLWVVGAPEGTAESLTSRPEVDLVERRHVVELPIRPEPDRTLLGRLIETPSDGNLARLLYLEGAEPGPDEVAVDQRLAAEFDLAPGDPIGIATASGWRELGVSGVAASSEYVWLARSRQELFALPDQFGVIYAPNGLVSELAGPQAVGELLVRFAEGVDHEDVTQTLTSAAIEAGASDAYGREGQPSNSALQEDLQGLGDLAFMFPMLFLTAAGLGMWVLLTRLVVAQRGVIGTLRASGYRRGTVFRHYLAYGVLIGLAGSIPGAIAGAFGAWGIAGIYTDVIGIPITVIRIEVPTVVIGVLFGAVAGGLAAWVPARRAMKLEPAEAMRGPAPQGRGKPTLLERLVPPVRRLPAAGLLVVRNMFRNPRRTLATVLGVVLAVTLVIVSWGMIDSVTLLIDRQFEQIERSDAEVVFLASPARDDLERIRAVDGISSAEPVSRIPVTLLGPDGGYSTTLNAYNEGTIMRAFFAPDGEAVDLAGSGLLVGESLRELIGVDVGDEITVRSRAGEAWTDTVAGFIDEPLGTFAYGTTSHLEDRAGAETLAADRSVLIRLDDGTAVDDVRADLLEIPTVATVAATAALADIVDEFLGFFYAFVGVMLVFGGILAFGLVFNAMTVNLAERTVEMATLKASGVAPRRLARMVTIENLAVTAVGLVPALLVGYLVAREFLAAYQTDQFSFTLDIRPTTYLITALFVVLVALVSQRPGLNRLRELDVPTVVRERSI